MLRCPLVPTQKSSAFVHVHGVPAWLSFREKLFQNDSVNTNVLGDSMPVIYRTKTQVAEEVCPTVKNRHPCKRIPFGVSLHITHGWASCIRLVALGKSALNADIHRWSGFKRKPLARGEPVLQRQSSMERRSCCVCPSRGLERNFCIQQKEHAIYMKLLPLEFMVIVACTARTGNIDDPCTSPSKSLDTRMSWNTPQFETHSGRSEFADPTISPVKDRIQNY